MKLLGSITVKNILIDLNILLDYYENARRKKYPDSIEAFDYLKYQNFAFVSSSSIDNFEFIKYATLSKAYPSLNRKQKLTIVHNFIKEFLTFFKIAKTPSYLEIDYDDIEDSQLIASAKAIDALVLTRDEKMLSKHPGMTISPKEFLKTSKKQKPKIDFANLKKQHFRYYPEIEKSTDTVYNHSRFIMGPEIQELEENLCSFTKAKNAITCSSGTDALLLAMMALDIKPGDEVITTPFTFIATAETIALLGVKPIFVDIDETTYNINPNRIEEKITSKTRGIISVSLYGQPSDLDEINAIAKKHNLFHIIDGAQSFGANYKGKAEVHHCDIYTTSFFPAKPLGCYGDGGAVLTNNDELAQKIRMLRVHGQNKRYSHKYIGLGARLDTIQAAILNVKLNHYKEDFAKRNEVAKRYTELLQNKEDIILPTIKSDRTTPWAQYSIRIKNRDEVQTKLKEAGIPTAVHYPKPLHLQECFAYLGNKEGDFPVAERISQEIMSLPMNPDLSESEIVYIAKRI